MFVIERHLYHIFADLEVLSRSHFFEHLSSPDLEQTSTCSPELLITRFLDNRQNKIKPVTTRA